MIALATGSSGLIGSEAVARYGLDGWTVHGVDDNQRMQFFGPEGDTTWNRQRLQTQVPGFTHHDVDVRDRQRVDRLVAEVRPDLIIHCAAQPSHDKAAEIPFDDFDTSAGGTLNLLEATRRHATRSQRSRRSGLPPEEARAVCYPRAARP